MSSSSSDSNWRIKDKYFTTFNFKVKNFENYFVFYHFQFLREELKYDSGYEKRHKSFHYNDDTQISVKELWESWLRSEVWYNLHIIKIHFSYHWFIEFLGFFSGSQLDGRANSWLVGRKCSIATICGDIPKTQSKRTNIAKVSVIELKKNNFWCFFVTKVNTKWGKNGVNQ